MVPLLIATLAMAGVGAAGNAAGWVSNYANQKKQLDNEIKQVKEKKKQYIDYMNQAFELETLEAKKKADDLNRHATQVETNLDASLNSSMDAFIASQDANLLEYNIAAQQAGQEEGNTLSAMAASGVKGSTLADAAEMQASQNSMQLQLAQDQNRAQRDINFATLMSNLGENVTNLTNQRNEAIDLKNRYLQGGMAQSQWKSTLDYNTKQYDNALSQLRKTRREMNWGNSTGFWNNLGNLTAATLGGAVSGAQTGYEIGTMAYKTGLWKE